MPAVSSAPSPVKLTAACLCGQALLLLLPLTQDVHWDFLALAALVLVALAVLTTSRRDQVRRAAIWIQVLIGARELAAMFDGGWFLWGALGLLVAGVGLTQLLSEPAQEWFCVGARPRRPPAPEPTLVREPAPEPEPALEPAPASVQGPIPVHEPIPVQVTDDDGGREDAMAGVRREGVVWLAYAFATRHLIRLLVPTLLVFVPIGLLALLGLGFVVDGSAAMVNGEFELLGAPGQRLLVWAAAALVASLAGQAVVIPATIVLATGLMLGKPVSASGAMRAAARRWPAMLVLTLLGVVVYAAIAAAGFGTLVWSEELSWAFTVLAILGLLAMPCLLAVAIVVLEGRSAWGALGRAYWLTWHGSWPTVLTLTFGVLVFPGLAQQAAQWATSENTLVSGVAATLLGLLIPPFQATVIARQFLHRLALRGTTAEFGQVIDALPQSGPRPARAIAVLTALLLPALLYGAAMRTNPYGWLEVNETVVTASWTRDSKPPQQDGRERPSLGRSDLQAMYAGQGTHLVMLMDGYRHARLLTCTDSSCAHTRYRWAEPSSADQDAPSTGIRLADGRLALTTWTTERDHGEQRSRLGLLTCDTAGCVQAPGGKPITDVEHASNGIAALATRPGGGLLIAHLHPLSWRNDEDDKEVLSVTTCDDPVCTRPRTKEVAKLTSATSWRSKRTLAAAVDADDRPIVLRLDDWTGAISVIACDDPACVQARMGRPVPDDQRPEPFTENEDAAGATMVLRPDSRPMIAYRDMTDGTIKLLDCHTRECAQATTTTLSTPSLNHMAPAMLLDGRGRVLVAYQDLDQDTIVIATCTGTRCTHTPVTKMRYGPGYGLTMAMDSHGRPVIAWMDGSWGDYDLVVTTPLNLF